MKRSKINQNGSLHLAGILMLIVIGVVAAIGVKVLNSSHANELGSNLISISSPSANQNLTSYTPFLAVAQKTQRQVAKVTFLVNDKVVEDAGLTKCYTGPQPQLPPRSYVLCFDASKYPSGPYTVVAKLSFLNGTSVKSFPVKFNVLHGDPAPVSVKILAPVNESRASGYVAVVASYSTNSKVVELTVNDKPIVNVELTKCYGTALPSPAPYTLINCFYTQTPELVTSADIKIKATAYEAGGTHIATDTVTMHQPIPVVDTAR